MAIGKISPIVDPPTLRVPTYTWLLLSNRSAGETGVSEDLYVLTSLVSAQAISDGSADEKF